MIVEVAPKSPVTWVIELECSEAEVIAWLAFLYRLRDGVVNTGIIGHDSDVLNNTFSPMYDGFNEAKSYS